MTHRSAVKCVYPESISYFLIGLLFVFTINISAANPEAEKLFKAGEVKYAAGKYTEAVKDYSEAIKLDSKYFEAYTKRGAARSYLKDFKPALEDLSAAISLKPKKANLYLKRALVKELSGDRNGAIFDLSKAIELNPKYADAYYYRGYIKNKAGDHESSIEDSGKAIDLYSKINIKKVFKLLTTILFADKDKKILATVNLMELVVKRQDLCLAYISRGMANMELKEYKAAEADFSKCLKIFSRSSDAYLNRGKARVFQGRIQEGFEDFHTAVSLDINKAKEVNKFLKQLHELDPKIPLNLDPVEPDKVA